MLSHILSGTLREHYLQLFAMAGGIAVVTGFAAAWVGAHFGARRAARMAAEEVLLSSGASRDRTLTALVQAVDTIAIEVERLSEGQRFTARLLAERPAMMSLPKQENPARVITPH